jgi:hypothetical protein
MRLLVVLGSVFVLLVAVATAAAAPRLLPQPDPPLSDPVFAGDGAVAWVAASGGDVTVLRADADGTVTQIAELPPARTARFDRVTYTLDVSTGAVAVRRQVQHCAVTCRDVGGYYTVVDEEYAGAPGGPLPLVRGCGYRAGEPACSQVDPCTFPGGTAVTGSTIAVVLKCPDGDPARNILELRPADGSGPATVFATDALALWNVTDDLILTSPPTPAYNAPLTVTLRRWPSGAVVTQRVFQDRGVVRDFRIGPDASIVYIRRSGDGTDHLWTLPAGGTPRDLGVTASTLLAVGATRALVDDGRLVSLVDGATTRTDYAALSGTPSFDGSQLAYRSRPCLVETIVVQDATAARPAELRRPCPPPDLVGAVHRAGRTISITLACAADPYRGCTGQTRVALPAHHTSAHGEYRLRPGEQAVVRLDLSRAARRWLAQHPRPRVNVRVRAGEPGSLPDPTGPLRVWRRTLLP